jgi:hypothetical protein
MVNRFWLERGRDAEQRNDGDVKPRTHRMFPVPSSTTVLDHDVKDFGSHVTGRHFGEEFETVAAWGK